MTASSNANNKNTHRDDWSEYWAKGFASSFAGQEYEGAIADHWYSTISELADGATVLDLCCGSGSIFRLIDSEQRRRLNLVGVDYAKLPPTDQNDFKLIGETNIEQLPFEDQSFDLVISQFGIEYADINRAIQEAQRVVKSKGRMSFICHHPRSAIVSNNKSIHSCTTQILDRALPDLKQMAKGLDLMHKANPLGRVLADRYRDSFNSTMSSLLSEFGGTVYETGFPDALKKILSAKAAGEAEATLCAFERSFAHAQNRLSQLFNAAQAAAGLQQESRAKHFNFQKFRGARSERLGTLISSRI